MANRWCDGLGRYGGDEAKMLNGSSGQAWAEVTSNWLLSGANPRTGSWHMRLGTGLTVAGDNLRRVFGGPMTEIYLGFALYCEALPDQEPEPGVALDPGGSGYFLPIFSDQANNDQIGLVLGTDGAIAVYRNPTFSFGDEIFQGVSLGRTVPIIGAGAYQHIEIYAKAGNGTAGALEVRVDEVTRLNLTGIDTVQTGNVEFSQAKWGRYRMADGEAPGTFDLADFYCNDTTNDGSGCHTFVGDCKSGVVMVNGDTAEADFTLSSGVSGYELIDEIPPNDSDYITTSSTTAESDFGLGNVPANISEILTVRPFNRAWKDDAGTSEIAPSLKSNGDKAVVTGQPITTAPAYYDSNVPLDPDTGAPWTEAALNAALLVVERTA